MTITILEKKKKGLNYVFLLFSLFSRAFESPGVPVVASVVVLWDEMIQIEVSSTVGMPFSISSISSFP